LNMVSLILFGLSTEGWMMYVILLPYAFAGIAGPAMQGLMSSDVPANEQGELQGGLTSVMSLTSIVGPLIMNNLFAFFTLKSAPFLFPGAPFMAGAAMIAIGLYLTYNTLSKQVKK
jgi:DHA1 family tetracycline resistance protein-like MFS transporter